MSLRPEPDQFHTFDAYCEALLNWNNQQAGIKVVSNAKIRANYEKLRELVPVKFEPFVAESSKIQYDASND